MKKFIKFLLIAIFTLFAITPEMVSNNLAPFGANVVGIDPAQGGGRRPFAKGRHRRS